MVLCDGPDMDMDLDMDMHLNDQLKQVKRELKEWERAFLDAEARKPNKDDIAADRAIHIRYKLYAKLKRARESAAGRSLPSDDHDLDERLQSPPPINARHRHEPPDSNPLESSLKQQSSRKVTKDPVSHPAPYERDTEPSRQSKNPRQRPENVPDTYEVKESARQETLSEYHDAVYDPSARPSFTSPPPPMNTEPAPAPWRKRDSTSHLNTPSPALNASATSLQLQCHTSRSFPSPSSSRPTSPLSVNPITTPKSTPSLKTASLGRTSNVPTRNNSPVTSESTIPLKADLPAHFKLKRTTIAAGPISTADIEAGIRPKPAQLVSSNDSPPSAVESPASPTRGALLSAPIMGSEYQEFVNRRRQMEALAAQQYEKEREQDRQREKEAGMSPINTASNTGGISPVTLAIKPISISVGPPPLPNERPSERHVSVSSATSAASRETSAITRPPPIQPVQAFVSSAIIPSSPKSATMTRDTSPTQSIFVKAGKRPPMHQGGDIITLDSPASLSSRVYDDDDEDVDVIVPLAEFSSHVAQRDSKSPRTDESHSVHKGTPIDNPKIFKRLREDGVLRCRLVRRSNGIYKTNPAFYLYNDFNDEFLLAARKKLKSKNVAFVISNSSDDMNKDGQHYIAKLKANTQRTVFTLFDARSYSKAAPNKGLKELSCITYSKTIMPREMFVAIPATHIVEGSNDCSTDVLADLRAQNTSKLHFLRNKPPRWNEATQSHCLNFGGRVTLPSIKNFQLITDGGDPSYIVMQFGRCGQDDFALDGQYPLTPLEAFSIALSTFHAHDSA
ncbi:hypothetical protein SeLEV6574_g03634 [Synchytrium endobioticum]|uniref:Tubby C-terminal domain-containing protein n=1 Tax=Synchytrium endobioticum TaxID=286115 RepID=A0A507D2X0_9FUNG|nr:hypothetical protein SeLEV6574_g03634 [Synchytrium endobioticum]